MLKLSNTMRNAALTAVLGVGLVGSAGVMLAPVAAQAQWHRDMDDRGVRDDRGFHRDSDDRGFRGDFDDRRFGGDRDDRWRFGVGVGGVGVGVYGYPYYYPYYSGYYNPYYYDYGPYCSDYDSYYGYCSY